jgi:hypothetical protein
MLISFGDAIYKKILYRQKTFLMLIVCSHCISSKINKFCVLKKKMRNSSGSAILHATFGSLHRKQNKNLPPRIPVAVNIVTRTRYKFTHQKIYLEKF